MQEATLLNEYLSKGYRLKPKDRLALRKEIRRIIKENFKTLENITFKELPINPDLIGNVLGVEFREGELDEDVSAELKINPERGFKYLAIINTLIDNEHHKRFSKFHECSHVLLKLFEGDNRAFRTPKINRNSAFLFKEPREIICDITASEMLFYNPLFEQEMKTFDINKNLSEQLISLSEKFDASLEATCRTFVENYPEEAFFIVVKEGYRRDEVTMLLENDTDELIKPVPMPRVLYAIINDNIKFYIPRNKSFAQDTIVYKSFYEKTNEDTTLDISTYGWGHGRFKLASISDEDRCYCVGIGLD